jgi:hypothetical protein
VALSEPTLPTQEAFYQNQNDSIISEFKDVYKD